MEPSGEGNAMSQDSDGIAEAMRGGAQLAVTLGAQTVETAARMRERSRLTAAAEATRAAEDAQRRLSAERAVALVAVGDRLDRAERAVADVGQYDSRARREALQAQLAPAAGAEAAAARAVADAAQARPAGEIADLPAPSTRTTGRAASSTAPVRAAQVPAR